MKRGHRLQKAFGYTYEEYRKSDSGDGVERRRRERLPWVWIPRWLCFPKQHRPLFDYFKQLFAQVTNPPIDAIREEDRYQYHRLCGKRWQPFGRAAGKLSGPEGAIIRS